MLEWSDVDIAVRDAVREFVDKEIRPHIDALESGDMEPYPIVRKLFATFGIDAMARESLERRLSRLRDGGSGGQPKASGGMFGGGPDQAGMGFVLISELCRVSMGLVTGLGVSLGLTVPTIQSRGTLAQQERWLPGLVTYEKIGAWAITAASRGSSAATARTSSAAWTTRAPRPTTMSVRPGASLESETLPPLESETAM